MIEFQLRGGAGPGGAWEAAMSEAKTNVKLIKRDQNDQLVR